MRFDTKLFQSPKHLFGSLISAHPPYNHNSVLLLFPFNMFLNFICLFPNSPNSVPAPFKSKFQWLRCSSSPSCLFPSRRRGLRWGWEGRRSRTRPCRSATRSGLPWRMQGQCYIINKLVNQNYTRIFFIWNLNITAWMLYIFWAYLWQFFVILF